MIPTYRPCVGEKELRAIGDVFKSRWLGMGPVVETFEQRLANFLGARHVILLGSGTAALHLALQTMGIGPGDEVIVPSFTFPASVQAITLCGATPVFAEICETTLTIEPEDLPQLITARTRAIMPVHFAGTVCDMDRIKAIADQHNIAIVEDAAHAFGSTYKGNPIGALGNTACFSFDPIKNITCGDGGAITTHNPDFAEALRIKRNLGITRDSWQRNNEENNWRYAVLSSGCRYHMNDISAAIGMVQLDRIAEFKARKQQIVTRYDQAFAQITGMISIKRDMAETFPFGYFVRILDDRRNDFIEYLKVNSIATRVQFIPNHLQPAFSKYSRHLPTTENVYREIVTLPLFYEMTEYELDKIISTVMTFFRTSNTQITGINSKSFQTRQQKLQSGLY